MAVVEWWSKGSILYKPQSMFYAILVFKKDQRGARSVRNLSRILASGWYLVPHSTQNKASVGDSFGMLDT
jgi:hypothetical protein